MLHLAAQMNQPQLQDDHDFKINNISRREDRYMDHSKHHDGMMSTKIGDGRGGARGGQEPSSFATLVTSRKLST